MKCTNRLSNILLESAIIIFLVRLSLFFVHPHFNDWDGIVLIIILILVIQQFVLRSIITPVKIKIKRNNNKRDNIFLALAIFIFLIAVPILVIEAKTSGGGMRGLATILISIFLIFPIILIVYIPWIIWFLIQYIKFRKQAYIDNYKSFWITIILFVYVSIHWIIAFWQGY
jgi:hypothetical protein